MSSQLLQLDEVQHDRLQIKNHNPVYSGAPDLDEWSGSESGGLASKPVETTRGVDTYDRDSTSTEREVLADTAHDVKDEAAENVKMGGTAEIDN